MGFQLKISDGSGNVVFETDFLENDKHIGVTHCPNARVTNDIVFVNHADTYDFLTLTQSGINFTGKIFVARCGKIHLDNMVRCFNIYTFNMRILVLIGFFRSKNLKRTVLRHFFISLTHTNVQMKICARHYLFIMCKRTVNLFLLLIDTKILRQLLCRIHFNLLVLLCLL